ncbi:hypothetical protein U9M48_042517, partial [Paspalum notatum var. saurae]
KRPFSPSTEYVYRRVEAFSCVVGCLARGVEYVYRQTLKALRQQRAHKRQLPLPASPEGIHLLVPEHFSMDYHRASAAMGLADLGTLVQPLDFKCHVGCMNEYAA